jgi:putative oxidoreductase
MDFSKGDKMKKIYEWFLVPPVDAPSSTILLRVMAGSVFLWEGVMKFVFTNQGVGRFTKLGFPAPHFMATSDAWLEIIGGALLIVGLLTRPVAILFVIEMLVAMASTKIPMFLGTYPLPLPPVPPQLGFWAVLHEIRSEYAQLACSMFVLLVGPGPRSMEALMQKRSTAEGSELQSRAPGLAIQSRV